MVVSRFVPALLFCMVALTGYADGDTQQEILAQLPADLEAKRIDPISIEKAPSFNGGEHLKFKLGWSVFSVAKSSMIVSPENYGDQPALKITLKTRTNSFADKFYKVRNKTSSYVAPDVSRSFEYEAIQEEGGRKRNTQALFDTDASSARYINHLTGEERDPVDILPGTFDPLAIVFFIRSLDFDVGDVLVVPTSNGKEFFYTIVRVVKKVERKFSIGKRMAYVLEPDIKDVGGVFKRSPDGKIRFFMSADDEKLPLRMESQVAVGSFWAELVEVIEPEAQADSVTISEIE